MVRTFDYDVFLSYGAKDRQPVHALAERLRADGLRVWLDAWVIQPGDPISLKIQHGLEQSRTLLLCMSPAYFDSEWTTLETHTLLFRDPTNAQRRFIPVLIQDCTPPDTIAQFAHIDWRDGDDAEYRRLVSACGRDLPDAVGKIAFSRQQVERDGFPFDYGSDLHWLWGWGCRLRSMVDHDLQPSKYTWMIFRPDRLAADAMMRFSVQFPHIIKQIDDCLDFTEERFTEFLQSGNEANTDNFASATHTLCERIETATPIIAANLKAF